MLPASRVFAARSDRARECRPARMAWRWPSPDNDVVKANPQARPGTYEDTPLMVNGVMYTATVARRHRGDRSGTGKTIWQYDPQTWKAGRPPQSRLHASRRRLLDRRQDRADHQRHARRVSDLARREDRQARPRVRHERPRRRDDRRAARRTHAHLRHELRAGDRPQRGHLRREHPRRTAEQGGAAAAMSAASTCAPASGCGRSIRSAPRRVRQRDLGERVAAVHAATPTSGR